jgi:3-isopropylmalate/(R)-2-methylmalate dehydratase large subunit
MTAAPSTASQTQGPASAPRTMLDKIWDQHVVSQPESGPAILYIDLHLVHEVTSPQAFEGLRLNNRPVRRPERTIATPDHNVPTSDRSLPIADRDQSQTDRNAASKLQEFGVRCSTSTTFAKASFTSSARKTATPNPA